MKNKFKQDKGQAGLTILLSVVVMLFVIGLLIMIFSLMGNSLKDSTYTASSSAVVNETITTVNDGAYDLLAKSTLRDASCTLSLCINSSDGVVISAGNYTSTGCNVKKSAVATYGGLSFNNTSWKCSYSYTWDADNTATTVINDTTNSIATTTDWFDIFIVITAMVVLILLTVIIVTAIRSSGMVAGENSGAKTVGTA